MFSVIITTYKRTIDVLGRAINSIVKQSYLDWELIVVNDFPDDKKLVEDIWALIEGYNDTRIKYIVHEKNKGACEARNTGIRNSNGEFIAFLDDDDEWIYNKLELMLPYLANKEVGLVYSDSINVYKRKEKIHRSIPILQYKNDAFKALLVNNYIGSTSFPIMRKSAVLNVGGFDPCMRACQDLDLWLKISKKYKIEYCSKPLTKYYFSDECITKNIKARIESHEKLIKKYNDIYSNDKRLLKLKYLNMAADFIMSEDEEYSKIYLNEAKKLDKKNIWDYSIIIKAMLIVMRNKIILKK